MITIKGSIPNISKAEAEVSTKLRAAYETDLALMRPHSLMFPGLHPTAMMSTVGVSTGGPPTNPAYGRPGPAGASPGGGGAAAAGLGASFMSPAGGGVPGRGHMSPSQIAAETTYLYIPNTAVGAIIGQ